MALYPTLPDDAPSINYDALRNNPHSLLPACSVCLDEFSEKRNPKYLSCHHTFCEECLHQMARVGGVTCPLCRQVTRMTSTTELQTNNDVLTMAKYGDIIGSLWCHDCRAAPKSSCATHHVDNRTPDAAPTLGQQVDSTIESWRPSVTRVVETARGWTVVAMDVSWVAMDATYSTVSSLTEALSPYASYLLQRLAGLFT